MNPEKRIAANRQNAQQSTGPRTDLGKRRSRRNALRHGLTAVTVIDAIESTEEYLRLQKAILAHYCPSSPIEYELSGQLVSLLWRLRRATTIETGLLQIQAAILHERKAGISANTYRPSSVSPDIYRVFGLLDRYRSHDDQPPVSLTGPRNPTIAPPDGRQENRSGSLLFAISKPGQWNI